MASPINIIVDIYTALFYVQYMLQVIHTILPPQTCVVQYIYIIVLNIKSGYVEHPGPMAVDFNSQGATTTQAHPLLGNQ